MLMTQTPLKRSKNYDFSVIFSIFLFIIDISLKSIYLLHYLFPMIYHFYLFKLFIYLFMHLIKSLIYF